MWINEDLTWKERRVRWLVKRETQKLRAGQTSKTKEYEDVGRRKEVDVG